SVKIGFRRPMPANSRAHRRGSGGKVSQVHGCGARTTLRFWHRKREPLPRLTIESIASGTPSFGSAWLSVFVTAGCISGAGLVVHLVLWSQYESG
ncbi:hypothetical protein, partial [Nocardia aurea]|uniref:hypothetical protein n=1 Tax=Nocardia aurea TaxID=2144174 RepID=UPI0033B6711B